VNLYRQIRLDTRVLAFADVGVEELGHGCESDLGPGVGQFPVHDPRRCKFDAVTTQEAAARRMTNS
jgi:hypothetical protein